MRCSRWPSAAILVVAVAVIASLTLLPAFLSAVGHNIERLRDPDTVDDGRRGRRRLLAQLDERRAAPAGHLARGRRRDHAHLASPVLSISVFTRGLTLLPAGSPTHVATERVARAAGPGSSGPAHIVARKCRRGAGAPQRVANAARRRPRRAGRRRSRQAGVPVRGVLQGRSRVERGFARRWRGSSAPGHRSPPATRRPSSVGGTASQERSLKNAIVAEPLEADRLHPRRRRT